MKTNNLLTLAFLIFFQTSVYSNQHIPDKKGMNIKGTVLCEGKPVANVQVSDGVNFTSTDKNGHYYLQSDKESGFIFICNPVGYNYKTDNIYPQFYKTVDSTSPRTVEQCDFELIKESGKSPAILFLADLQMCGRNNDIDQFTKYVVPDVNTTLDNYRSQGKEAYIITLGDQAYNTYWNLKGYGIQEIKDIMEKLTPDMMFNCMGNHDNIPATGEDRKSEETYRRICGPTYYSFNLGGMHYVILDNIMYNDKPGLKSYDCDLTDAQLKWLEKDIMNVSKDTPLVLCMHAPLFNQPMCDENNVLLKPDFRGAYGERIQEKVKDFKDVKIFSGHTHVNNREKLGNITEYNVAGACGSLWWTGHYTPGHSICTDGSPAGYQILIPKDGKFDTYYKSVGFDKNYQFCCYDLNKCNITAAKYAPNVPNENHFNQWLTKINYGFDSREYFEDGSPKHPNRIMINVFGFGPGWSIEAFENGKRIDVKRINGCDPLSTISDGCKRREAFGKNKGSEPKYHSHLFIAQASAPNSPITVKVTDDNGKTYTQAFNRPTELSIENYIQRQLK